MEDCDQRNQDIIEGWYSIVDRLLVQYLVSLKRHLHIFVRERVATGVPRGTGVGALTCRIAEAFDRFYNWPLDDTLRVVERLLRASASIVKLT